jgi:hypothetical protein
LHRRTRHSDPRDGAKTAEGRGRLCAIILVTVSVIQGPFFAPRAGHVSYGELKAFVKKGKIANPTIGKETIGGTLSADGPEGLLSNESVEELNVWVAETSSKTGLRALRWASAKRPEEVSAWSG